MGELVAAALTPHPPLLIPEIGGRELDKVARTVQAMRDVMERIGKHKPDTIVVISPHGPVFGNAFGLLADSSYTGDFSQFGVFDLSLQFEGNAGLLGLLKEELDRREIPVEQTSDVPLDYATLVPLYYLQQVYPGVRVVPVAPALLTYQQMRQFGQALSDAVARSSGRVGVIASGDLSHRLIPGAPAGYHPDGKEFDRELVDLLDRGDWPAISNLDRRLVENAGECGFRPLLMLMGLLETQAEVQPEVLSYEGPFGVGYAVVYFAVKQPMSAEAGKVAVRLAREAVTAYVREARVIEPPADLPAPLRKKRAVFVSIKKHGELRGCIGTVLPVENNAAQEIVRNAIMAATEDPRFPPVAPAEVPELKFSVDILQKPEPVDSLQDLDPDKYGVIVRKGRRTGLLLPALEGIATASQQVAIARQKAGIGPDEDVEIQRFTVTRYVEDPS